MGRVILAKSVRNQIVNISILHLGVPLRSETLEVGIKKFGDRVRLHGGFDARINSIPEEWSRQRLSNFVYGRNLIPGEIAAAFGHSQIIRSHFSSDVDWALIIEDNVSFVGLTEIIDFLGTIESDHALVINFLSDPMYNNVKRWEKFSEYYIGRTSSIPTLSKCYAINSLGIKSLNAGLQKNGFAGFEADFPAFYDTYIDFLVVRNSGLHIANSTSHIGPRESLEIIGWISQIYNAVIFLISPKNGMFRIRLNLFLVSCRFKFRRRSAFKQNSRSTNK